MIYNVPVSYEVVGYIEVEADSLEDLLTKLEDDQFVNGLPAPNGEVVDGSYEVLFDAIEDSN